MSAAERPATLPEGGMLVLLQGELQRQAAALQQVVQTLRREPQASAALEQLRGAAQGIVAAAQVAHVAPLIDLGGALAALAPRGGGGLAAPPLGLVEQVAGFCERLAAEPRGALLAEAVALGAALRELSAPAAPRAVAPPRPARAGSAHDPRSSVSLPLIAVYREEVEAHAQALVDNLLALEQRPADPVLLDAMMRAAHSIKGAARIVSLTPAARLAHQMEELFVAARAGRRALGAAEVDLLLRCTDALRLGGRALGDAGGGAQREPLDREVDALCAALAAFEPASPEPAPASQAALSSASLSLRQLFRDELTRHAKTLADGLLRIEQGAADDALLEELVRAAHSIKGGARVAQVEPVARLAQRMEELLGAARRGERSLDSAEMVDRLLRGTDALAALGQVASTEGAHGPDLERQVDELCAALDAPLSEARAAHAARRDFAGAAAPTPAVAPSHEWTADDAAARGASEPVGPGAEVKVGARVLNQLMELTGEALVRARALDGFSSALREVRGQLVALERALDALAEQAGAERTAPAKVQLRAAVGALGEQIDALSAYAAEQERLTDQTHQVAIGSRMRPFADVVVGYPRMVRDISRQLGQQTRFEIVGADVPVDREILAKIDAPLTHLLRNALDHGLEPPAERVARGKPPAGKLRLAAQHHAGMLRIVVADDGRGIDEERLRQAVVARGLVDAQTAARLARPELFEFLYLPSFSTRGQVTQLSGRGVGLDVVRSCLQTLGGKADITSTAGQGVTVSLLLPVALSVIRALLVRIGGELYACRLARIERCLRVPREAILVRDGRAILAYEGRDVGLLVATELFERPPVTSEHEDALSVVLIGDVERRFGLVVDRLLGERDLVVRPLDPRLGQVQCLAAAAIVESGEPVLVLDVDSLVVASDALLSSARAARQEALASGLRVLVIDDSATVRKQVRDLLAGHGFVIETAEDGMDGWSALTLGQYDAVVTDIDMPRMNGLELIRRLRASDRHRELPVIVVSYKDRVEDRAAALAAGATRYFTKSELHDTTIVEAVRELIGNAEGAER